MRLIGLLWIIGAVLDPVLTKTMLGKSVDLIHNLFGVLMHQIATIQ